MSVDIFTREHPYARDNYRFYFLQKFLECSVGDAQILCLQGISVLTYVKTYFFYNLQLSEVYTLDCRPVLNLLLPSCNTFKMRNILFKVITNIYRYLNGGLIIISFYERNISQNDMRCAPTVFKKYF